MVFSSLIFLLYFLPIVLGINFLIPGAFRNYWLLICSLFFYAWGAPVFIWTLLVSVVVNYLLVGEIHKRNGTPLSKWLLAASVMLNVGLLLYFKYSNFFIENVNELLQGLGMHTVQWTLVALPIGISFFTFQSLTYSVDVYSGVHKPLTRMSDYALYIMLFPQMIAGPIVRFHTIADQIEHRKVLHSELKHGVHRFLIGLAKKVLIANTLSQFASDSLVTSIGDLSSTDAWLGIFAYTFQIYFDFSGYSDMAIGMGLMLGFKFPENFDNPYTSKSITEFWRRWHITLGVWMRDYLYIPLGGSKVSTRTRLYFNLVFVFLISGLWHGANWNFVFWGAFHGFFLVLERIFLLRWLQKVPSVFRVIYCFFIVIIGWVFFSIDTFDGAIAYLKAMFSMDFSNSELWFHRKFMLTLILAAIFSFFILIPKGIKWQSWLYNIKSGFVSGLIMNTCSILAFILIFMHLVASGFNPFIYFRF